MSLTSTPKAERLHIGFFGLCNAGKSSLINAVANQKLSIVSPTAGTTTDTVQKAMELPPLGPVVLLDTAGFDDTGELGALRVLAAQQALDKVDAAVLVHDAALPLSREEKTFLENAENANKKTLVVCNKCDLTEGREEGMLYVSAETQEGIEDLKAALVKLLSDREEKFILKDLVQKGDLVLLVTPIDEAAPKGRIILPQQQTLRELLDLHATVLFCQPQEVEQTLEKLAQKPRLCITDSQAFSAVAKSLPEEIPLTSFSILFARYKGELSTLVQGAKALKNLKDGAQVLICEGCTHHRSCGDIGTVKLPAAIRRLTGKELSFSFTQGSDFPVDVTKYDLIVHCGGCMLGEAEVKARMKRATDWKTPITNYGIALAAASGILPRALSPFGITL
ncbi:MAG: [Clostridia bacterium]|nr:[FeFe] hydrogenase H-cluster maturation GTPase HydF [Clostridia bacterium]